MQVFYLLEEYGFIEQKSRKFSLFGNERFYLVNQYASNIVVSGIADRIARQYGWNTITDSQIDFTVNSLNAFQNFKNQM